MFVKKYVVGDMAEAMFKIRRELGSDAVILSSRSIRPKGLHNLLGKKQLEVTVAYEPAPPRSMAEEPPRPQKAAPSIPPLVDPVRLDVLGSQLAALEQTVLDFSRRMASLDQGTAGLTPTAAELNRQLLEQDVAGPIAADIAARAQAIAQRTGETPRQVASQLVLQTLGEPSPIRLQKYKTHVVILVGPTGVGKTTTLVKLAGLYTCVQGLKVGLINADTYRVAAQEQLLTYARIMDIPLRIIYTPDELPAALLEMADRDVVLIDTAGKHSTDEKYHRELTEYLTVSGEAEVLLTLSAVTGERACRDIIESYAFLPEYKLILTKMDEVSRWGGALNAVVYSKRPLAYTTAGQNVPGDIETANLSVIAASILGGDGT